MPVDHDAPRGGFTPDQIEEFRRQSLLSDAYQSPFPGIRLFHRLRIAAILSLLREAAGKRSSLRFLEIGCGDGFLLEAVGRERDDLLIWGLDLSLTALGRTRALRPQARLVKSDAARTPFPDGAFDLLLCSEVLEHHPDDASLLQEIRRLLSPGGRAILTTPNLYTLRNRIRIVRGKKPLIEIREHLREYSLEELREKIARAGIQIVRFTSVGFYLPRMHWFFRSALFCRFLFLLAHPFPRLGRDFIFLLRRGTEGGEGE